MSTFLAYIGLLFFYYMLAARLMASGLTMTEALCIQILIVVVGILVKS
jgi:hypothetical protein